MGRTIVHQEKEDLNHDVEKVWRIVSDFSGVAAWIPTVSDCVVKGEGVGAVRTVTQAGTRFDEALEILNTDKHLISYRILDPTPFPMQGAFGTIQVEQKDAQQCRITWTADAESVDEQGMLVVQSAMKAFIKSSIGGFKAVLVD